MAWLMRIFGINPDAAAQAVSAAENLISPGAAAASAPAATEAVPIERQGLDGKYDQSGLAKRVVKEFDDAGIEDAPHLYVEQHNTEVIFTGHVKEQSILDQLKQTASGVAGCTGVDTSKVAIQ